MKARILYFCVLILGIVTIPSLASADPAIVNDIVVDARADVVTVTIICNQVLSVESFKNEKGPTNYIVLDFLGSVYTDLPPIIEVDSVLVEKISLVRGEEKTMSFFKKDYYTLDFLAVNLKKKVDYKISQQDVVIDLVVLAPSEIKPEEKTVKKPPVVLKEEIVKSEPMVSPKTEEVKIAKKQKEQAPQVEKKKKLRKKKEKKARVKRDKKGRKKAAAKEKKKDKPVAKKQKVATPAIDTSTDYPIDKIVQEAVKEKQKTAEQIKDLSTQLNKMEGQLNLSKGEQSELEGKINEILSKLNELRSIVDEQAKKKDALGEKIESLVDKKRVFIKAKQTFDTVSKQRAQISTEVDDLSSQMNSVKSQLDSVEYEKKKLEEKMVLVSTTYSKLKSEYETKQKSKNELSNRIDKTKEKIEQLKNDLIKDIAEEEKNTARIKVLEDKNKTYAAEISGIKEEIEAKNSSVAELEEQYKKLKTGLEDAAAKKFHIENSYRNAKTEYESIQRDIERYLENKK